MKSFSSLLLRIGKGLLAIGLLFFGWALLAAINAQDEFFFLPLAGGIFALLVGALVWIVAKLILNNMAVTTANDESPVTNRRPTLPAANEGFSPSARKTPSWYMNLGMGISAIGLVLLLWGILHAMFKSQQYIRNEVADSLQILGLWALAVGLILWLLPRFVFWSRAYLAKRKHQRNKPGDQSTKLPKLKELRRMAEEKEKRIGR